MKRTLANCNECFWIGSYTEDGKEYCSPDTCYRSPNATPYEEKPAEKVSPTANEGLVGELRDAVNKWEQFRMKLPLSETAVIDMAICDTNAILEMPRYRPVPSLPVEPLAVLCERKGICGYSTYSPKYSGIAGMWVVLVYGNVYRGDTYEAAELAARAFLSSLKDKEGGV
jgi:hypothetical protein